MTLKGSLLGGYFALLLGKVVGMCDLRRGSSGEGRKVVEWRACMVAMAENRSFR